MRGSTPEWRAENALKSASSLGELSLPNYEKLTEAIQQSLLYYEKTSQKSFHFGIVEISRDAIVESYKELLQYVRTSPAANELSDYLGTHFTPYRSAADQVLFTGYYVPRLKGSFKKTERFAYPIYQTPTDLIQVALNPALKEKIPSSAPVINRGRLDARTVTIPYYSRKEIEQGALSKHQLELLWVDDKIDLFFLHIQGSGVVELPNGKTVTVGFADKNGWPYVPIGKTLIEKGILQKGDVTMMSIKDTLRAQPAIVDEILESNPSFVFFRKLPGKPVGSLGVPVTGDYSIATDTSLFPQGALAVAQINGVSTLRINQDTGGAIRGAGRADLFFGDGDDAATKAGAMQEKGMLYFLAPKKL